jgi:hypothetical protein
MISQDPETTTELINALHKSGLSVYLSQCNSLLISHILSYTSTALLSTCSSTHDTKPKNTKENSFSSSPQPLAILKASLLVLHQNPLLFFVYLPIFFISSAHLHIFHKNQPPPDLKLLHLSTFFLASITSFPSPLLSRRHPFHFNSLMQLHSLATFAPPPSYTTSHTHPKRDLPMHSHAVIMERQSQKKRNG